MSAEPPRNIRLPHVLLDMSAERLRNLILTYHTMTAEEVKRCLILTHREIYAALDLYTNDNQTNIPRL